MPVRELPIKSIDLTKDVMPLSDFQRMRDVIELIDDVRAAEQEIERGEEISQDEFERELLAEGRL